LILESPKVYIDSFAFDWITIQIKINKYGATTSSVIGVFVLLDAQH